MAARDKKTSRNRAKIRDLTTLIKNRIYALDGGELSELRRTYPSILERHNRFVRRGSKS